MDKRFRPKIFGYKQNVGPKNCLKTFRVEKILGRKFIQVQKNFPKKGL